MKYSLLDLTQTILSSMDSDEVNSINDTPESLQVATLIRSTYFDIISRGDLKEHFSIVTLDASGDLTKPTLMTLPDTVGQIVWLRYDKQTLDDPYTRMEEVEFLNPDLFFTYMYGLDQTETEVGSFTHTLDNDEVTFFYRNDRAPQYYTVFDDYTFIFDSFDTTVDSTLQKSKTLAYARNIIPFDMEDNFIPDLDEAQFSLLLNEAKSLAWAELRQMQHPKAEQNARRAWTSLQRHKYKTRKENYFDDLPSFGRR